MQRDKSLHSLPKNAFHAKQSYILIRILRSREKNLASSEILNELANLCSHA